jgi:hypothetical protein
VLETKDLYFLEQLKTKKYRGKETTRNSPARLIWQPVARDESSPSPERLSDVSGCAIFPVNRSSEKNL